MVIIHFGAEAFCVSRLYLEPFDSVLYRVQNPQSPATGPVRAVHLPIRVEGWIALVGRSHIVNKGFGSSPIPL